MTDYELDEMYKTLKGWTWVDTLIVFGGITCAVLGVVLFGFVLGIGMELARGLF